MRATAGQVNAAVKNRLDLGLLPRIILIWKKTD